MEQDQEVGIVRQAIAQKFTSNEDLRQILLATGEKALLECNPYDDFYATGLKADDKKLDNQEYHGKNILGKILEETRGKLKS